MSVEFGQGPWGDQALQKIMCVSGSFVKDSSPNSLYCKLYYFEDVWRVWSRTLGRSSSAKDTVLVRDLSRTVGSLNSLYCKIVLF